MWTWDEFSHSPVVACISRLTLSRGTLKVSILLPASSFYPLVWLSIVNFLTPPFLLHLIATVSISESSLLFLIYISMPHGLFWDIHHYHCLNMYCVSFWLEAVSLSWVLCPFNMLPWFWEHFKLCSVRCSGLLYFCSSPGPFGWRIAFRNQDWGSRCTSHYWDVSWLLGPLKLQGFKATC